MNIALRMDDVGASSKNFEVYSKNYFGNFLFLKYLKSFKAWGPYNEIDVFQWELIIKILRKYSCKLTIGVTATWVDEQNKLIPYNVKFKDSSVLLKNAVKEGLIEIANHGLTHCVLGKQKPRLFSSNRKFHREFWDWLPSKTHSHHIKESQSILRDWLSFYPQVFVPPGNVYSKKTLKPAINNHIRIINTSSYIDNPFNELKIVDNEKVFAFHDREIVLYGHEWLEKTIINFLKCKKNFIFISEID